MGKPVKEFDCPGCGIHVEVCSDAKTAETITQCSKCAKGDGKKASKKASKKVVKAKRGK